MLSVTSLLMRVFQPFALLKRFSITFLFFNDLSLLALSFFAFHVIFLLLISRFWRSFLKTPMFGYYTLFCDSFRIK